MTATGADLRRGPFAEGERVQLTDAKGRMHTITLAPGKQFHTHRGYLLHDDLIGAPDGTTVTNTAGFEYLALRPLLADYVMSMPRGAAVVYPKDAGQIVTMADIFPGAVVVEAGVGSGALSMSLLRAVGESGRVHSFERREDFADIAKANARAYFGEDHPAWTVTVGDLVEALPVTVEPGTVDRVVLDMLAPWECLDVVAEALAPGGVLICYVATATQLSKVAEAMRDAGRWTEPNAWESLVRGWHLEGLAVRPQHRMHGHTGFLITTRLLAPGVTPPRRTRRPGKGYEATETGETAEVSRADGAPTTTPSGRHTDDSTATPPSPEPGFAGVPDDEWTAEAIGERVPSDKRVRKVRRGLTG
ncbi:tRNA (adenine57-N1/adenine58-N1)-methyltransferase [Knoellia remsis]|uniref:tRNA (Adenine57-N1/adenine58-N1)-methyltransferase n=1 Tax=Knoellia remsis TaxID=407159 RepID=A0A2T0UA97_9MICO|nr:tRNA (adenine-N1)-methyltransferase [Knoellia remsis]PRY54865.1 tRNA (adenine57-N1/adenine58-N1)-methyltransferase [Knoellia remsis]